MREKPLNASPPGRTVSRAYRRAVGWVTLGWSMVAIVGWVSVSWVSVGWVSVGWVSLVASVSNLSPSDAGVVAVASLMVAYVSMIPGLLADKIRGKADRLISQSPDAKPPMTPWGRFYGVLLAGILIRLLGTVALFLTCRYQLASAEHSIAAMTIGWYVLLTSMEVVAVTKEMPVAIEHNARSVYESIQSPTLSG